MSNAAARRYIEKALKELADLDPSHTADHVEMYLNDALIWMGEDRPAAGRPPHPNTMIGRG